MIVSVDHGNKSIKTPNYIFTSGVIEAEDRPGMNVDYIFWNGKYYSLTEKRISYLRDKTEDNRFFVLTLFAIAYEMRRQNIPESLEPLDVTLLVGLPPAHYGRQHTNFEAYFLRKRVALQTSCEKFSYNLQKRNGA